MNILIPLASPHLASTAKSTCDAVEVFFHATGECAVGKVLVARSVKGVCAILLGDDTAQLEADLAARFPKVTLVANEAMVRGDLAKVIRFVEDPAEGLNLPLDMRGTPLQRRVWEKMRAIPVGRTVSYLELGRWIGPLAARVVANACAANPIALAIPCHRVIRSDGDLAGFRWGIERKRELIRREKEIAALKADKTVPEAEKKDELAELEAALNTAKPIQFKENIALVLKYYDKLLPLMQEPGRG
jgi:O-6-methylguanine DNA methyltransferase